MNQLFVVGIGPGEYESMSIRAERILKNCQIIIGYTVYVELIQKFFPEAEFLTTPMRKEKERCELAFSQAEAGKMTALICSGDAGVYGMAGLVLSMAEMHPQTEITIVPGITAASSGAAVLGAPLMHDFAVISLSDLLTPWETIEARLRAAAEGDFVICLYNPASKKRADYLERACRILLNYKPAAWREMWDGKESPVRSFLWESFLIRLPICSRPFLSAAARRRPSRQTGRSGWKRRGAMKKRERRRKRLRERSGGD